MSNWPVNVMAPNTAGGLLNVLKWKLATQPGEANSWQLACKLEVEIRRFSGVSRLNIWILRLSVKQWAVGRIKKKLPGDQNWVTKSQRHSVLAVSWFLRVFHRRLTLMSDRCCRWKCSIMQLYTETLHWCKNVLLFALWQIRLLAVNPRSCFFSGLFFTPS